MSGDFSDISGAVGDAAIGAAAAKAVEPATDGKPTPDDGHTHENACLNCGTPLVGAHCHACGQKAHVHRSLRGFLHDLVHGVLHFEGKFWRTLPLLIWRPGRVIREYIEGKRARYLSPIALFLFTVFVSFALFSAAGGFGEIDPEIDPATAQELRASLENADQQLAKLNTDLTADGLDPEAVRMLREEIAEKSEQRKLLVALLENATVTDNPDSLLKIKTDNASANDSEDAGPTSIEATADGGDVGQWLQSAWQKGQENPGLLLYKLQTNSYKLSWLLIPLSLPFMWLLFPFSKRFKMYDHTVFVTYSISFMTMLAVVLSFGIAMQVWPLIVAPLLYAPFHLYRSLRGAYSLSRLGAAWRMLLLSICIWITMSLFVLIMVGIVISG